MSAADDLYNADMRRRLAANLARHLDLELEVGELRAEVPPPVTMTSLRAAIEELERHRPTVVAGPENAGRLADLLDPMRVRIVTLPGLEPDRVYLIRPEAFADLVDEKLDMLTARFALADMADQEPEPDWPDEPGDDDPPDLPGLAT
jgi:hypothetical protein